MNSRSKPRIKDRCLFFFFYILLCKRVEHDNKLARNHGLESICVCLNSTNPLLLNDRSCYVLPWRRNGMCFEFVRLVLFSCCCCCCCLRSEGLRVFVVAVYLGVCDTTTAFLVRRWHRFQTLEGSLLERFTMVGMRNLNQCVSTLAQAASEQVSNAVLSDDVMDMSSGGYHTGTWMKKKRMRRIKSPSHIRVVGCIDDTYQV